MSTSSSSNASQGEIVVGLDIGTTKVCAVVGEIAEDGITILGVGSVPCRGLRKGIVSNIDWTTRSIKDAIEAAQTMAGVEIRTVYAGVAGSHIRSQATDGVAAIAGGEGTRADVERAGLATTVDQARDLVVARLDAREMLVAIVFDQEVERAAGARPHR